MTSAAIAASVSLSIASGPVTATAERPVADTSAPAAVRAQSSRVIQATFPVGFASTSWPYLTAPGRLAKRRSACRLFRSTV